MSDVTAPEGHGCTQKYNLEVDHSCTPRYSYLWWLLLDDMIYDDSLLCAYIPNHNASIHVIILIQMPVVAKIVQDAVDKNAAIAVFEINNRDILSIVGFLLTVPLVSIIFVVSECESSDVCEGVNSTYGCM